MSNESLDNHGTYGSVFREISAGAGQEAQKLWHRNIPPMAGLLLTC